MHVLDIKTSFLITFPFLAFQNNPVSCLFSLIMAVLIFLTVIFISFFYPFLCLSLALICIYNPYNTYIIFTNLLIYGRIRALISVFFIVLLSVGILLKASISKKIVRLKTPLDIPLLLFLIFPVVGAVHGFFVGNSVRLILNELFPILEFTAFFFLTTLIIKDRRQCYTILKVIIGWLLIMASGGIIFYFFAHSSFAARALLVGSGLIVPRLYDFMPVILFPLLIGLYLYPEENKPKSIIQNRIFILCISLIPLLSLLLSFFRSLWIAIIGSLFFKFMLTFRYKRQLKAALGAFLIAISIFLMIDLFIIPKTTIFDYHSLSSVVYERAFNLKEDQVKAYSISARIKNNIFMLAVIYDNPLIGIGLGSDVTNAAPNYYLILACTMGLPALFFAFWMGYIILILALRRFKAASGIDKGWILGIAGSFVSVAILINSFPAILHFPIPAYMAVMLVCLFTFPYKKDGQLYSRN